MSRREYDNPAGGICRHHPTLNWASNILAARSIPKGREGCRECFPHSTPLDWLGSEWMETKPLAAYEFPALLRQQVVPETEVLKLPWMFSSCPPPLSSKAQAISPRPETMLPSQFTSPTIAMPRPPPPRPKPARPSHLISSQLTGHGTKQTTTHTQAAPPPTTPFFPAAFPFPFRLFVLSLGFSAAIPVLHTSA